MSNTRSVLTLAFLVGSLGFAPAAFAGKKETAPPDPCAVTAPAIKNSGIPEMDAVFTKASALQASVATQTTEVCGARTHLNEALGIAKDAPVGTAFNDLKAKAMGKVKIATGGAMPKLEASEAMPENVQAAIDAANAMIEVSGRAAKETAGMLPEAKALGATAAGFPMKVPTMKVDGVDIPTALKVVGDNVKAIKQLPNQIEGLGNEMKMVVTAATGAFGG